MSEITTTPPQAAESAVAPQVTFSRTIVVGLDGTSESLAALNKAAELAEAMGGRVQVVHVRHPPGWWWLSSEPPTPVAIPSAKILDQTEAEVRAQAKGGLAGLQLEFVVAEGYPEH